MVSVLIIAIARATNRFCVVISFTLPSKRGYVMRVALVKFLCVKKNVCDLVFPQTCININQVRKEKLTVIYKNPYTQRVGRD